jgi:hypothetical protein
MAGQTAETTLLSRDKFREGVFARDGKTCVVCGAPGQDAHHIIERRLFPDGGYYLGNGATVCGPCHLQAEATLISVEDIRRLAGIAKKILPPGFYDDHVYDKWGNTVLADGRRMKGELFEDESVQKVLKPVLHLFSNLVKYPRTWHLPWSAGITDDDRVMTDLAGFHDHRGNPERVIVTRKMDGENSNLYRDHYHARSIDGRNHYSRNWVKNFWSQRAHDIPEGWRICGENLNAVHSIRYSDLPSWFMGFSVWNEKNARLSWDDCLTWFELLDIVPVPVLYDGPFDERKIRALYEEKRDWQDHEGYVVSVARSFSYGEFSKVVGKYVRSGHVMTTKHWMFGGDTDENGLAGQTKE